MRLFICMEAGLSTYISVSLMNFQKNIPLKLQNTVSEYVLTKKDVIGVSDEPERDYDLMEVILYEEEMMKEVKRYLIISQEFLPETWIRSRIMSIQIEMRN